MRKLVINAKIDIELKIKETHEQIWEDLSTYLDGISEEHLLEISNILVKNFRKLQDEIHNNIRF